MQAAVATLFKPKIAKKFGGRLKAMISGGAPLNPEVGLFFESLGLTFLQGYGQTEAAPVISCNRPKVGVRMDSVGPALKDTEVRIAEDGEILVRGELVMHGYWRNDAETAKVLKDGWLHTGDIGEIDDRGRIRITDRKKDLIINDKGENVAPQKVEGMLTLQPEIAQAMIVGDKRPPYAGRSSSAMMIGSPPISTTSACPIGCTGPGAVTAKYAPTSWAISMVVPVNDTAGWMASGMTPAAIAGASTAVPYSAAVCSTSCPGCHAPVEASPATSAGSSAAGTARITSSLRSMIAGTSRIGTPWSIASARSRLDSEIAEMPTTA